MQKHKTTTPISETRVYKARDDAQGERERERERERKETEKRNKTKKALTSLPPNRTLSPARTPRTNTDV